MHADREDELHDATGKTVRLTKETRTARDTDNPDRESIVGKDPKSKKHRRSKTPVELTSSVEVTPKLPKVAPATDATEEADAAEIKSNKADRKRLRRKAKAVERAEKKKSHQSSDVPHTVITTASPATLITAKKGTSDQPPTATRVGAAITRFRTDDKINICRENASIFVGLPRGYKSHSSAEALQIAVIQRLKAIRVAAKGVAVTAAKFVWIRLSSSKERDWTLKKFANFKFTLDGVTITPEVVRYGERKEVSKDTAYQISRASTTTEDLLIALANHIIEHDKTIPGFQVYELLCAEQAIFSLIIHFTAPPSSLGRKVKILDRPVTHLTNGKCILCKSIDHNLWNCPYPPEQISSGFSLGPPLFEFEEGATWDPRAVRGLEDLQLQRQRAKLGGSGGEAYDSDLESDSDTEVPDAPLDSKPGGDKRASAELKGTDDKPTPRERKERVDPSVVIVAASDGEATSSDEEEGDPVDERPD